jgi:hypothetical protein
MHYQSSYTAFRDEKTVICLPGKPPPAHILPSLLPESLLITASPVPAFPRHAHHMVGAYGWCGMTRIFPIRLRHLIVRIGASTLVPNGAGHHGHVDDVAVEPWDGDFIQLRVAEIDGSMTPFSWTVNRYGTPFTPRLGSMRLGRCYARCILWRCQVMHVAGRCYTQQVTRSRQVMHVVDMCYTRHSMRRRSLACCCGCYTRRLMWRR